MSKRAILETRNRKTWSEFDRGAKGAHADPGEPAQATSAQTSASEQMARLQAEKDELMQTHGPPPGGLRELSQAHRARTPGGSDAAASAG